MNEGFCLVTGYTREEVIGHTSVELGLWSLENRRELMERITEYGTVSNLLVEIHTKTRETRLLLLPFVHGGGQYCTIDRTRTFELAFSI